MGISSKAIHLRALETPKPTQDTPLSPSRVAPNSTLVPNKGICGQLIEEAGEWSYEIGGVEQMEPFLMTLASDSDHWLFILSNGALTAGRSNPDGFDSPAFLVMVASLTVSQVIVVRFFCQRQTSLRAWCKGSAQYD